MSSAACSDAGYVASFGGGSCAFLGQHASIKVIGASTISCDTVGLDAGFAPTSPIPTTLRGRVVAISGDSFRIDTCPPDANCPTDGTTSIEVTAPCVRLPMQLGQLVEVQYLVQRSYTCQQSLEVRNLPRWGSLDNPAGSDARLLLAVVDGGGPFPESTYTVEPQLLTSCAGARQCGARTPGLYALRFASRTSPAHTWDVAPDQTRATSLQPGAAGDVVVHNLRSYQTDGCDDYWNFAYTMWSNPR